ncbi:MAG: hypothetical protein JWN44_1889 [Myxococcales bacterium]|nr:hypothetical protein [Myxococcales bacterium]
MHVDLYVATVMKLAALLHLTAGIYAVQAPGVPLTVEKAAQYAAAASYHGSRAGIDPYVLVGIARNESDFVENTKGPDGKDCGLTQTRVTITKYTCKQLLRSYWLAFQEAAREMKEYSDACKGHADFDRCRLNHYNSGVRYAKSGFHGAYWLRVQCFAEAARQGVSVGQSCRKVRGRGDIARAIHRGTPHKHDLMAAVEPRPSS